MKPLTVFNSYRVAPPDFWRAQGEHIGGPTDDLAGVFVIQRRGVRLRVIATSGDGWDHVSVSCAGLKRCPIWEEMSFIAAKFFGDQAAFQFHVPSDEHVNNHPYCLHWWRPIAVEFGRPPHWMVGMLNREKEQAR
jgi:hypothetical protein